jgi:hypothetical protein
VSRKGFAAWRCGGKRDDSANRVRGEPLHHVPGLDWSPVHRPTGPTTTTSRPSACSSSSKSATPRAYQTAARRRGEASPWHCPRRLLWTRTRRPAARDRLPPHSCFCGKAVAPPSLSSSMRLSGTEPCVTEAARCSSREQEPRLRHRCPSTSRAAQCREPPRFVPRGDARGTNFPCSARYRRGMRVRGGIRTRDLRRSIPGAADSTRGYSSSEGGSVSHRESSSRSSS